MADILDDIFAEAKRTPAPSADPLDAVMAEAKKAPALPSLPKPPVPAGLQGKPLDVSPNAWTDAEQAASRQYGEAIASGVQAGTQQMREGARKIRTARVPTARLGDIGRSPSAGTAQALEGVSDVFRGGMSAVAPVAAPVIIGAGGPAAVAELALGTAAQEGVERGLKAVGAPEGVARFAGDVAGGFGYSKSVSRAFLPAKPKPIEALGVRRILPNEAPPVPIPDTAPTFVPPDAGPVPKGPVVKSAAESAEVFRSVPAPKDAAASAAVFERAAADQARKAQKQIEVPETGVPENVARAVDARERIAQQVAQKPWAELDNSERLVIDALIAEGNTGASVPAPEVRPQRPSPLPGLSRTNPVGKKPRTKPAPTTEQGAGAPQGATAPVKETPNATQSRGEVIQPEQGAAQGVQPQQPTPKRAMRTGAKAATAVAEQAASPQLDDVDLNRKPRPIEVSARRRATQKGAITLPSPAEVREATVRTRTQLTDEFAPIHDLTAGKNVPADADPYQSARLYAGHGGKVLNRLDDLRNILMPTKQKGVMDAVAKYSEYERLEELSGRGITKFPNGQTIQQIQAERAALEQSLGPKLADVKRAVGQLRLFHDNILREAKDAGIISDAAYQAILAKNEKYTPLQRMEYLADKLEQGVKGGSDAFTVASQDLIQPIKGSEKEVVNPLESTIRKVYRAVSLMERNKVARQVADLSQRPEFSGVVEKAPATGHVPRHMEKFSILRNGVKEEYVAPTLVVESMKRMHKNEIDMVTRAASLSSRALRAGATTMNIPFGVRNIFRDFQSASVNSPVGFTPMDWLQGFAEAMRRGDDYRKFLESGGSFSGYYTANKDIPAKLGELTESTASKVVKTALNPFKLIPLMGETTELAPRLGVFKRSMKKGNSPETAAFNARNATVDFSKSGTAVRVFNLWVPFLNARLQGSINTVQAFRERPMRSAMIVGGMIGVPAVATYLNNTQNFGEVWDDIAQHEKDANFLLIYGKERDERGNPTQIVKIPKGDVGRIFGNPLENFLEWTKDKNPKGLSEVALQLASDASPIPFEREGKLSSTAALSGVLPPTAKAAVEGATNRNLYTDRPIVRESLQDASPSNQYEADTPKWLVALGQKTNISPLKWQNFLATQFGGVGRQIAQLPSLERTGKTIAGTVVGARGGEQDARTRKQADAAVQAAADERVTNARKAELIYKELAALPEDQIPTRLQQLADKGDLTEDILDRMERYAEQQQMRSQLSGPEMKMRSASVPARAMFAIQQLEAAPEERRESLLVSLIEKGIVTDAVLDEIEQRQSTAR